ncbi:NRDE family protein [Panacibacter ginsenosidivorans]|uniref:NRDE family protein n=1 Tax=Panacibacter ginsenosidivorans TaxID=1813871 RepID=A0A5B8V4C9_9BACT|nr:NRDE family protein [Panacibacter ginsenosidivorans]QEC66039.1 NRDE family protein [Panacibacter ginsenosidivorans]
MCTVTFIPVKDKFFITSNRDEKILRKPALPPKAYTFGIATIIYPKDADAGGTWIAMHENGNAVVLLNGGFEKHIPAPSYKKSRGIVLLEVINAPSPLTRFHEISLSNIEPFTLVLLDDNNLYECRWDGDIKHAKELNNTKAHIWSSVTLYDKAIIQKREQWFIEWINTNPAPSMQDILHFHLFAGDGDDHNDLRMNRNNKMLTVSATGMEISNEKAIMHYLDLNNDKLYKQELRFSSSLAV